MRTFISTCLLPILLLSSFSTLASSPVASKEEARFVNKADQKMLDLLKTRDFVGFFYRESEANPDLQTVDLYAFKNIQEISMTKELCTRLLERIYGPLSTISLKVRKLGVYKSHSGNTCEAQLDNEDSKAKHPERRTFVGFLRAQPYAIVFKLSKKSTPDAQENMRKFWDSLR